jgi:hypothetical protein
VAISSRGIKRMLHILADILPKAIDILNKNNDTFEWFLSIPAADNQTRIPGTGNVKIRNRQFLIAPALACN